MASTNEQVNDFELRDEWSWDIDSVVGELRQIRERSLAARNRRNRPARMPSRTTLAEIVAGISAGLFPNRLGATDRVVTGVDYYVAHRLDSALRELCEQIVLELRLAEDDTSISYRPSVEYRLDAIEIVREFAAGLPRVRKLLDSDIEAAFEGDPAARSVDEILVCYPAATALIHHRLAHLLHELNVPLVARVIAELAHSTTGIDIHPGAKIGGSFFIDHGTGVVIGETCVIGKSVRLYQAVTLGAKRLPADERGILIKGEARHPIVEDDVVIYAGATILGRVTIGRGSVIGGNVWITNNVPPESKVTQARARHDHFDHGAGI
jgi:serine O-acetyltransferase